LNRTIPLILLCAFIFNFCGYTLFFFAGKKIIRSEAKAEIKQRLESKSEFEKIILHKDEAHKYFLCEDELKIDGKIYDIASQETAGENIVFHCIHDEFEEKLFAVLDEFLNFDEEEDKEGKHHHHFVKFLTLESNINSNNTLVKTQIILASLSEASLNLSSLSISPDTLPPRYLFV